LPVAHTYLEGDHLSNIATHIFGARVALDF